jgi:hypothetical protein
MDLLLPVARGEDAFTLRLGVVANPKKEFAQLPALLGLEIPQQAKIQKL